MILVNGAWTWHIYLHRMHRYNWLNMSSVFVLVWFDVGIGTKSNPASDFLDMQIASEWARARALWIVEYATAALSVNGHGGRENWLAIEDEAYTTEEIDFCCCCGCCMWFAIVSMFVFLLYFIYSTLLHCIYSIGWLEYKSAVWVATLWTVYTVEISGEKIN